MFYVKGSALFPSFSKLTTTLPPSAEDINALDRSKDETQSLFRDNNDNASSASFVVHSLLATTKVLPALLLTASCMSLLAYFYTVLLIPTILAATITGNGNATRNGINVPLDIGCPFLAPRAAVATSVHDLRPDDIRIVAGLGDSVMAGFAADGIQNSTFFNIANLNENRGVSFAMGGDPNRVTVPNIIHYYSNNLYGSSVGNHTISICFGNQICPDGQYRPENDVLNSAQSGARSLNLDHEIDYLLGQLTSLYKAGTASPTDWKLLTIFIGSNDICHSCAEPTSLPPAFAVNVLAAVERLRTSMTNVLIQIVGMMRVYDIVVATTNYTSYCEPIPGSNFIGHDHECECSHTDTNRTIMANYFPQYNAALEGVAQYYQNDSMFGNDDTFTVVFQPLLVDIMSFPIEAISNIDCFHPSALAHSWLSKMLWNMMYMTPTEKNVTLEFDTDATIFCPDETSRIQTVQ